MTNKLVIQNARISRILELLRALEETAYESNYELSKSDYGKDLSGPQSLNGKEVKQIKKKVRELYDGLTLLIDKISGV